MVFRNLGTFIALLLLVTAIAIPVVVTLAWVRRGRRRDWPKGRAQKHSAAFVVLWIVGLGCLVGAAVNETRRNSKLMVMIPSQVSAALNQFYVENDHRIFAAYSELVGPERYVKAVRSADGEDLGIQFPIRRDWSTPLTVRLPDGTTTQRYEVIAAVGRSGLIATYPRPDPYSPDRVYRLDCGISYRGNDVVDLPPDPAGRQGRDQDGIHIYRLDDGRRYEITYRGGVPDGPFRAFFADGRPWGEATYEKGRLVGPAWLILRDGRKIDELADGEAAQAAMAHDQAAATTQAKARPPVAPQPKSPAAPVRPPASAQASTLEQTHFGAAQRKAAARDYAGAETEITALIDSGPPKFGYFFRRARLRFFQGNFDGALADYGQAELLGSQFPQATLERAHVLRAKHDLDGAAREFRAVLAKEAKRFHPSSGRAALWLYVVESGRGQTDDARRELEEHLQRVDAFTKSEAQQASANLDTQLAGVLLGRATEAQAEAAVNSASPRAQREFRFKFLFFNALARRLAGDEAGARERFQRASAVYPDVDGYDYERTEVEQALAGTTRPASVPDPSP